MELRRRQAWVLSTVMSVSTLSCLRRKLNAGLRRILTWFIKLLSLIIVPAAKGRPFMFPHVLKSTVPTCAYAIGPLGLNMTSIFLRLAADL